MTAVVGAPALPVIVFYPPPAQAVFYHRAVYDDCLVACFHVALGVLCVVFFSIAGRVAHSHCMINYIDDFANLDFWLAVKGCVARWGDGCLGGRGDGGWRLLLGGKDNGASHFMATILRKTLFVVLQAATTDKRMNERISGLAFSGAFNGLLRY